MQGRVRKKLEPPRTRKHFEGGSISWQKTCGDHSGSGGSASQVSDAGQRRSLADVSSVREMFLPIRKIGTQAIQVKIREGVLGATEISQGAVENGARTRKIFSRLVMKGDGQLNHPLKMAAQWTTARRFPPGVFEFFVGVEEMPGVEQGQSMAELAVNFRLHFTDRLEGTSRKFPFLIVSTT
jgi:hypothetical protein